MSKKSAGGGASHPVGVERWQGAWIAGFAGTLALIAAAIIAARRHPSGSCQGAPGGFKN
ncbi:MULTISPECIES: hypothetical protein [Thiorhodovibrio]|uniref:hypothetical protein n=1 Tax=Thiorhodovibrio TaxID=61593 RepID=UPI00191493A9|nr:MULTISPECIES: hypothetical protein [Thiorhodovibrio]